MTAIEWTDAAREAVVDALVMSPMSNHVGTDLAPVSRTADAALAALAPFVWRALVEAREEAQAEATEQARAMLQRVKKHHKAKADELRRLVADFTDADDCDYDGG